MAVTHLCFSTAVHNRCTSSFTCQEILLFRCPTEGVRRPSSAESRHFVCVCVCVWYFFSIIQYNFEEGVGRKAPESKTLKSLGGPGWQREEV